MNSQFPPDLVLEFARCFMRAALDELWAEQEHQKNTAEALAGDGGDVLLSGVSDEDCTTESAP